MMRRSFLLVGFQLLALPLRSVSRSLCERGAKTWMYGGTVTGAAVVSLSSGDLGRYGRFPSMHLSSAMPLPLRRPTGGSRDVSIWR